MNTQIVIGVFDQNSTAAQSRLALVHAGFDDIEISGYAERSEEPATDGQLTDTTEYGESTSSRGSGHGAMLTVQIPENKDTQMAVDILREHGAYDINEFVKPPVEPL